MVFCTLNASDHEAGRVCAHLARPLLLELLVGNACTSAFRKEHMMLCSSRRENRQINSKQGNLQLQVHSSTTCIMRTVTLLLLLLLQVLLGMTF